MYLKAIILPILVENTSTSHSSKITFGFEAWIFRNRPTSVRLHSK